jgi:hypothetical protein
MTYFKALLHLLLLEDYHLIMERRSVFPNDPESYAGGSVGPPMPDRSKGRDQMKCSPWSTRWGVGCGAYNPTMEKFTDTKPRRRPKTHTEL